MLRQMTVDPQYSKRGVYLHKSNPSSPMTPLQSTKPALGEIGKFGWLIIVITNNKSIKPDKNETGTLYKCKNHFSL